MTESGLQHSRSTDRRLTPSSRTPSQEGATISAGVSRPTRCAALRRILHEGTRALAYPQLEPLTECLIEEEVAPIWGWSRRAKPMRRTMIGSSCSSSAMLSSRHHLARINCFSRSCEVEWVVSLAPTELI